MDDIAVGTATDVEPFVNEGAALIEGAQDTAAFKKRWIRLIGQADRLMPGETWTYINEIFYAVEEHLSDPGSRAREGGLDDEGLRLAVSSQLPALHEELDRVRAIEEGRSPPRPLPDTGPGLDLLRLIDDFLRGTVPSTQFAASFQERLENSRAQSSPRVRAAVEAVGFAVRHFRPEGAHLRMHDIDETVLRRRVADIEPRLAAAVGR